MLNEKKGVFTGSILGILILLISSFMAVPANADEHSLVFPQGKTTAEIGEGFTVEVDNNETSTVIISSTNGIFYENSIDFGVVESIITTQKEEQSFFTVINRLEGSGNMFHFIVLEQKGDKLEEVYSSPFYERASYELVNEKLQVTYPIYGENDIASEPEEFKMDSYVYGEGLQQNVKHEGLLQNKSSVTPDNNTEVKIVGSNPSAQEINRILTEEANKRNMPPEIVKAIAYQESGLAQYWNPQSVPVTHYEKSCTPERAASNPNYLAWDGTNVKLGYDCIGIGIMQVSDWRFIKDKEDREEYVERLKHDVRFNIQEGLAILEQKWRYSNAIHTDGKPLVPAVNDMDRRFLDNWYFTVFAYNGMLSRNDPTANNTKLPYQTTIYNHIKNFGLVNVTPFPVSQLKTYLNPGSSVVRFEKDQYNTSNLLTMTKSKLEPGNIAYTTETVNIRSLSNVNTVQAPALTKGTRVTILNNKIAYPAGLQNHYTFIPVRTDSGREGYVASSYLDAMSYSLAGVNRYETGVSISNHGWENQFPDAVVLGRGDLPIDSLTGSVLAANKNAPLLLTTPATLQKSIVEELTRLSPQTVYVLGGESAISKEVADQLSDMKITVRRVTGSTRYETALSIANVYAGSTVNEIFLTTGDEKSPDALSIASHAGAKSTPILLTTTKSLREEVTRFIKDKKVKKVTIVGGTAAVSTNVENQLKSLGVSVERVSGSDRYETSVAIAKKYFPQNDHLTNVFFARGDLIVDALSGSALAAKYNSPMILTRNTSIPGTVSSWLNGVNATPTLFYLGSESVITPSVRQGLEKIVLQ